MPFITNTDGTIGNVVKSNKIVSNSNDLMRYKLLEAKSKDTSIQKFTKKSKAIMPTDSADQNGFGIRTFMSNM
jgi:hypothetical protein